MLNTILDQSNSILAMPNLGELGSNLWSILLLVIGFSLVIFVHELGHFLAAKWAGVRVHQFAIGFGRALVSYRKGLGGRVGSTEPEFRQRVDAHLVDKGLATREEVSDPNATNLDQLRIR